MPARERELVPSVPDNDDLAVNGVAGVTGALPYGAGLPGHRTLWLNVESVEEETVEAERVEASLKAGETVPFRNLSRWTWTILSRICASPEPCERTSCLSASILEIAGKDGLDGVLAVVVDRGSEPGRVYVGEGVGEVGSW